MSGDLYPHPSSPAVSATMRGNRRRDTGPERALRTLLHRSGLRYRVDWPIQAGGVKVRPDIVFTRQKVAIFVDGCFWHACPEHGTQPQANIAYWAPKLRRNQERDERVNGVLRAAGWTVLRVWEHDDPAAGAAQIQALLTGREGSE